MSDTVKFLLDRIIKDAKSEAKQLIKEAKDRATGNIFYAKQQADKQVADAITSTKKNSARHQEIQKSATEVERRIEILKQKTQIVDKIFEEVKKELPIDALISKHKNTKTKKESYDIHLSPDEIMSLLREDIEAEIVSILFGDVKEVIT